MDYSDLINNKSLDFICMMIFISIFLLSFNIFFVDSIQQSLLPEERVSKNSLVYEDTINLSNTPGNDLINQPSTSPDISVLDNNIYVVWAEYTRSNDVDKKEVYFKKSIDGGATFGDPVNLSEDTGISDVNTPKIIASDNNVYVLWEDNALGSDKILFRSSRDGGVTFENIVNITKRGSAVDMSASGSNLYFVWHDHKKIYFTKTTDGGTTFENATILKRNTTALYLDIFNWWNNIYDLNILSWKNNIYIMWHDEGNIYFTKSTDNGTTFEGPIKLRSYTYIHDFNAVASNGNLYFIWNEGDFNTPNNIYFTKTTDGGTTFENATLIRKATDSTFSSVVDAFKNNIYVVWVEDSGQISDRKDAIYFTKSTDNGTTFENAILIRKDITNFGRDHLQIASSENGLYLIGEEDNRFLADTSSNRFLADSSSYTKHRNQEIFLMTISPSPTLASKVINQSDISKSTYKGTFPIKIDGQIVNGEWIEPDVHKFIARETFNNKGYEILFASKSDGTNLYFAAGVDGPKNFTGGAILTLYFDNENNGKVDPGDDAIVLYRGFCCESEDDYSFKDMYYTFMNNSNVLRNDETDGGLKNGHGSILFSNNIEYFELSHPLCSSDHAHDLCITMDNTIGLYYSLKLNGVLYLDPHPFGDLNRFGIGFSPAEGVIPYVDPMPVSSLVIDIIPPAAFILEPFGRITDVERSEFLKVLTPDEQYELLNNPTGGDLTDFLNKLEPKKLTDFLGNLYPDEIKEAKDKINKYYGQEDKFYKILSKLDPKERDKIINKIQS